MTHVSRPLIGLLAATVLVFAVYTVALKPASSTDKGGSHTGAYQSAIAKARAAQGLVNGAATRDGGSATASPTPTNTTATTTPSATTPSGAGAHGQSSSKTNTTKGNGTPSAGGSASSGAGATKSNTGSEAGKSTTTPSHAQTPAARRFHAVQDALDHHKVLAMLFYNPSSPDDRTVATEMASIPTHSGAVVKLALPLQEVASYASLLSSVPVNFSPTLVLIDRQHQAQEITGFATAFEIDRRVADVLGS